MIYVKWEMDMRGENKRLQQQQQQQQWTHSSKYVLSDEPV